MEDQQDCRICLDNKNVHDFVSPCKCSGTLKYVHQKCFSRWLQERATYGNEYQCEICKTIYLNYSEDVGLVRYLVRYLNLRQANTRILKTLLLVLNMYMLYFVVFSGSLEVTIHSAHVPDMDILIWEKSDAYVVVCVDKDCQCETDIYNDNNHPRWEHQCQQWRDKSVFVFSRITFMVFDSDFDRNDDFIGQVNTCLYRILFKLLNGKRFQLKWDTPYKGRLTVTVRWISNLQHIFNYFN